MIIKTAHATVSGNASVSQLRLGACIPVRAPRSLAGRVLHAVLLVRANAAQLLARGDLPFLDTLDAVAHRSLDIADVRDEAHEPHDLDARRLIGAPHRAVQRDVALDE